MKKAIILLVLLEAVALVGLFVFQQKETAKLRGELAAVQQQLTTAQQQLADAEAELAAKAAAADRISLAEQKAKVLQETLKQSSEISATQSRQVAELEQSLAAAKTNKGLAGIFDDPEMRKMIKEQQKAVLGPMIQRNYGQLFKDLNLSPEQTDKVKALLEQRMSAASDLGMSMLGGDPEKRKELAAEIRKQTEAADQAIKELLGSANYETYKNYEASVPDRMNVAQFRDQLSGPDAALNSAQEQQLIDLLSSSRKNFNWTTDYSNQTPPDGDFSIMFNEDRLTRHAQEQTEYNRQVIEQSRQFLNPDQIASFERFLENQRKMQEAAMKMAGKMFGK